MLFSVCMCVMLLRALSLTHVHCDLTRCCCCFKFNNKFNERPVHVALLPFEVFIYVCVNASLLFACALCVRVFVCVCSCVLKLSLCVTQHKPTSHNI